MCSSVPIAIGTNQELSDYEEGELKTPDQYIFPIIPEDRVGEALFKIKKGEAYKAIIFKTEY